MYRMRLLTNISCIWTLQHCEHHGQHQYLHSGVFGVTDSSDLRDLLMPNWFSAKTLKWYCTFSFRPFTTREFSVTRAFTVYQAAFGTSRLSMMYPWMSAPPSSDGGLQLTRTDLA